MKIHEIYRKYRVTPNLQEHMLRVCSIVEFIQRHWQAEGLVDWNFLKKIALLHDLGNTVKFDLDKNPEFLGKEKSNIRYWKQVQKEIIKKYGLNDHEATKRMLQEIGVEDEMIKTILQKSFGNSVETKNSNNWPLKILYYADLRILPFGIGTLKERIDDVRDRMPKYTNRPDFDDLVNACREIEEQIQSNLTVSVNDIGDKTTGLNQELLNLEV